MPNLHDNGEIEYFLFKNNLIDSPNQTDFLPRTASRGSVNLEHLIKEAAKGGSSITEEEFRSTVDKLTKLLVQYLIQGYKVVLPFASFKITVKGRMLDKAESIDSKPYATVKVTAGQVLIDAASKVNLKKIEPKQSKIYSIKNLTTELASFTAGDLAIVKGASIGFDLGSPLTGLFFVDASGNETRVLEFSTISATMIKFKVPPLVAGEYSIKIVNVKGTSMLITQMEGFITVT